MNPHMRSGARLKSSRLALVASALAVVLALATPATAHDAILTIDGQRYHFRTLGTSGAAVVFEAGLGNDSSTWKLVAGPVAQFARVVLYDRPGLGQSLPMLSSSPVTAEQVATNLHKLLTAADIRPPWVLVGHSLGGLYVQMLARKYPREAAASSCSTHQARTRRAS